MMANDPSTKRGFLDHLRNSSNGLFGSKSNEASPELLHMNDDTDDDTENKGFHHDRQGTIVPPNSPTSTTPHKQPLQQTVTE